MAVKKVDDQATRSQILELRPPVTRPRDRIHRRFDAVVDKGCGKKDALCTRDQGVLIAVDDKVRRVLRINVCERIGGAGKLMLGLYWSAHQT